MASSSASVSTADEKVLMNDDTFSIGGTLGISMRQPPSLPGATLRRTKTAPAFMAQKVERPLTPPEETKPPLVTQRSRRVWRKGPRPPRPKTAYQLQQEQLSASIAAIDRPITSNSQLTTNTAWLRQLNLRGSKLDATRKRVAHAAQQETATLEAQLDAIFILSSGKFYVNPNDRATLLHLVSSMQSLRLPLQSSPLTAPTLQMAELAWKRRNSRDETPASGSNDPVLDALLSKTVNYAHKHRRRHATPNLVAPPHGNSPAWRPAPGMPEKAQLDTKAVQRRGLERRLQKEYGLTHMHDRLLVQRQQNAKAAEEAEKAEKLRLMLEYAREEPPSPPKRQDSGSAAAYIGEDALSRMQHRQAEIAKMEAHAMEGGMVDALRQLLRESDDDDDDDA